jgi:hypothetical protein
MNKLDGNGEDYIDQLIKQMSQFPDEQMLGEDMQTGTRLSKTDKGARTNARIEAAQSNEGFDESGIDEDELKSVNNDVTEELFKRKLETLFGK